MTPSFDAPLFEELFEAIARGERKIKINGLWGSSEAYFLARLLEKKIPFCLVTPSALLAQKMRQEINFFAQHGEGAQATDTVLFPAWDILPYEPGLLVLIWLRNASPFCIDWRWGSRSPS
jgi:transcription-repair coupling factor (superfamily II helicase)